VSFLIEATRCLFKFHQRSELLIRTHNEPLTVVAMRVHNPDCSPFKIQS